MYGTAVVLVAGARKQPTALAALLKPTWQPNTPQLQLKLRRRQQQAASQFRWQPQQRRALDQPLVSRLNASIGTAGDPPRKTVPDLAAATTTCSVSRAKLHTFFASAYHGISTFPHFLVLFSLFLSFSNLTHSPLRVCNRMHRSLSSVFDSRHSASVTAFPYCR